MGGEEMYGDNVSLDALKGVALARNSNGQGPKKMTKEQIQASLPQVNFQSLKKKKNAKAVKKWGEKVLGRTKGLVTKVRMFSDDV